MDFSISIRPTTYSINYLPEDVSNFKCGLESLSPYVFENVQGFFRFHIISGNKPVEQLRNRLIERYKYLLPTMSDGAVITSNKIFRLEVAKSELTNSGGQRIVVEYTIERGDDPKKTITFPNFKVTNKFPDNVIRMKSGAFVVCTDIHESPKGSKHFWITCRKFGKLENAFTQPFVSSKFGMYTLPPNYRNWLMSLVSTISWVKCLQCRIT